MALVARVLGVEGEGDEGGDVGAAVARGPADLAAGGVEVDSTSLGVVLRCVVREDGGDGLSVWDDGTGVRGARRGGSRRGACGGGRALIAGAVASCEGCGGGGAEETDNDGGDDGLSVHFDRLY